MKVGWVDYLLAYWMILSPLYPLCGFTITKMIKSVIADEADEMGR